MARKVYDIKPPRVAKKQEKQIKEFLATEKKKKTSTVATAAVSRRAKKEKNFSWKGVYVGVALAVILIGGFLYFKLQKATIEIWPEVTTLSYAETITADKSAGAVVLADNIIPAKYVEIEKTETQEFPATGNASDAGRAGGTVTMYNKAGTSLTLKTNTHLLSDSGKYFVTLSKVTIPAGTKSKPGSVKVKVEAVEGGEAYNIGPATFSVPKLSGTDYYYSTYAESSEAMTGGYADDVKKVTEDDISSAKSSLIEKVTADAIKELGDGLEEDYILLSDALSTSTVSSGTDTKAGTVTDKFNYEVTLKVSGFAFRKSDLEKFARDYIISQMVQENSLLDSSLATDYSLDSVDAKNGKVFLGVNFSAGTYKTVNKNSLALLLTGKTSSQISQTISDNLGESASRVKVNFWPFWVKKSPKTQKGIEIELKF